jgi:hypothetical protein
MFAVDLPSSCKDKDYGKARRTANIKANPHRYYAVYMAAQNDCPKGL